MALLIQDPNDNDTVYLIEALLEACCGACRGGGAFSFASAAGAQLLLDDEVFRGFAATNKFDLVVGIDAITDTKALDAIDGMAKIAAGLQARVFFHELKGALFHPKLCWFRHKAGGRLVVGSGNLTVRGLRGNWEAFAVNALNSTEANAVESVWTKWTQMNLEALVPLTDSRARERAKKNGEWAPLGDKTNVKKPGRGRSGGAASDEADTGTIKPDDTVLIAEIPRGGNRWNQANFDLDNYKNFFGAKKDTQRRMIFQHVDRNGKLGELESRPSIAVKSRNWRFELDAGAGLTYPAKNRPIGVFVRVATRNFRYHLLMPRRAGYAKVLAFLRQRWTGLSGRVRRVRVEARELQKAWPDAKLWDPTVVAVK